MACGCIDDQFRAADRARIDPSGFGWNEPILLAPQNECRHDDAPRVACDEMIIRRLKTPECRCTRAPHAREIPVTVDHLLVDDAFAHDRVIKTFDHECSR